MDLETFCTRGQHKKSATAKKCIALVILRLAETLAHWYDISLLKTSEIKKHDTMRDDGGRRVLLMDLPQGYERHLLRRWVR